MHLSLHLALDKQADHTNSPRIKSNTLEFHKPTRYINGMTRKDAQIHTQPTSYDLPTVNIHCYTLNYIQKLISTKRAKFLC